MNKNWIIGIVVAIVIIGGLAFAMNQNNNEVASTSENTSMTQKDEATQADEVMENKDQQNDNANKDAMMNKAGAYKDYSADTVKAEQSAGQKVVLFFHAPWCPFCKAADLAFKAKLDQIPFGVTVLKTDYDSNTELKKKYGVTYQHTFVQIDSNGNMITKWNGGDIDALKQNLK